ncbi:hypothetical protein TNCV_279141 [Trichonephila clavipes]|nr:hypothetical protein TNCV_279141 [Trichonephila clavipes]
MIAHLGLSGRQRFLDIINCSCSWNKGQLPRGEQPSFLLRNVAKLMVPLRVIDPSRLITSIACKIMEKMVLRRLTFHLNSSNLLPEEQYGFREGHSIID